jgi:O-antigen biosynthesis protein
MENTAEYCIDRIDLTERGEVVLTGWTFSIPFLKENEISVQDSNGKNLQIERKNIERPDVNHTYNLPEEICSGFEISWKIAGGQKFTVSFGSPDHQALYQLSIKDALFQQRENRRHFKNFSQMRKEKDTELFKDDFRYLIRHGYKELKQLWQRRYEPIDPGYTAYFEAHKASEETLAYQREHQPLNGPKISILVPTYKTKEAHLRAMIESVMEQTYENWQLCIADGSGDGGSLSPILEEYHKKDARVLYQINEKNFGISGNTNEALKLAEGEFVALLDHDDLLAPDALYECAALISTHENADALYTDEDKFSDSVNGRFEPAFKPDFNLDLLRSNNYICHLFVTRRAIAEAVGGFHSEFDGSQDYDFVFRCTEKARAVYHIPKVLYYWRSHPDSVAENPESKTYAYEAGAKAIEAHLERCGEKDAKVSRLPYWGLYRVTYGMPIDPVLSVITRSKEFSERRINEGIEKDAEGEYYLFLDPAIHSMSEKSRQEMLMHCFRKEIGVIGSRVYDSDNRIAQAGFVLGMNGLIGSVLKGTIRDTIGYCAKAILQQDYSAVSPAAYIVSKEVFLSVGGFDENLTYPLADIDLQLRIGQRGLKCLYEPEAEFNLLSSEYQGEEGISPLEKKYFAMKWSRKLSQPDPYYNVNFSLSAPDFSLRSE